MSKHNSLCIIIILLLLLLLYLRYRTGLQKSLQCAQPLVGSFLVSQVYGTTAATMSPEASATLKLHYKIHPPFFCYCNLNMYFNKNSVLKDYFGVAVQTNLWHYSLTCLSFCLLLKMALFVDLP